MPQLAEKVLSRLRRERFDIEIAAAGKDVVRHNKAALTYLGLHPMSLVLAGIRPSDTHPSHVNLMLPELSPESLFAGIKTALDVGFALAENLQMPLRIVVLNRRSSNKSAKAVDDLLALRGQPMGQRVEVLSVDRITDARTTPSDVWVATYWTTAHALDVAAKLGTVNPARVVYLIQDYEPAFFPWSTNHSLATAGYSAGFVPLVNSSPLRNYLQKETSLEVPEAQTFRPQLDLEKLESAANARVPGPPKVIFYGRPSKPRNMFGLGIAALRASSSRFADRGLDVAIESIGEKHARVPLPTGGFIESLGKMSWDEYFSHLATSSVLFSLQASPHPSHPPLDSVVSGGFAVMNEVGGTRGDLHARLSAVAPESDALADALVTAVSSAVGRADQPRFDADFLAALGVPLDQSVAAVSVALANAN
jgi:hypothetical protein